MDASVTRQELLDRLKSSVGANYLSISSVFTGVTLFVAADTLTRFVTAPSFPWELVPLWLTGFLIMIFAYGAFANWLQIFNRGSTTIARFIHAAV